MSDRSDTLLLTTENDGTTRIGLLPRKDLENYYYRAKIVDNVVTASHMICSPEGELFCVVGSSLYRGPIPSKAGIDWFSTARKVGKSEWNKFKIIFFHPNGEMYGTTNDGSLHKGPQPDNEYVPWLYDLSTQIGDKGWDQCEALFFHPSGELYAVTEKDKLLKAQPPTNQDFWDWNKKAIIAGGNDWLKMTHYICFTPEGKLLCVRKGKGILYIGFLPEDGKYKDNAENLGFGYDIYRFLNLTKDKTISSIIEFNFLPENGHQTSENVEVIANQIFDNRKSSTVLRQTFSFEKTEKTTSSFSQDHGFTVTIGASLKFTAGVPFIADTESKVQISGSTTHQWNFTETNETEVKFSSSSGVEVSAGKAIRMMASVVRAQLVVPYLARVKTVFGFETEVEGTWNGASLYNMMVSQEDYDK